MLFAITPVVTVFCLLPSPAPKNPRVWRCGGGVGGGRGGGGQRGLLQQNQTSVSRAATQTLVVSTRLTFQNERVAEQKKNVPM